MRQKGQLQVPACACLGNRLKCKTKFESELVCLPGASSGKSDVRNREKGLGTGGCRGDLPDAAGLARRSCFCAVLCFGRCPEHNTRGPAPLGRPIGVSGSSCGDVRAQIGKSLRILVLDEGSHPRYHFLS